MIRGVLLDVGDTLTTPRGGRWNPRFDFEETLAAFNLVYAPEQLPVAIAAGDEYLNKTAAKGNRDDYHRIILEVLDIDPIPDLLTALDAPLPFSRIVEVFPDVEPSLATMKGWGLSLGIVSDTGAEAHQLYAELGWTPYFEAYAISAELGCCKPDPRMYTHASDALGLEPSECLFVDNDPDCVRGAARLGYWSYGISRYGEPPGDGITWVRDLDGLLHILRAEIDQQGSSKEPDQANGHGPAN